MTTADLASDDEVMGPRGDRPKRRMFTAAFNAAVLVEYDVAERGQRGQILRREGLYSSHLVDWRRARDAGVQQALGQQPGRPRRDPRDAQIAALTARTVKAEAELARSQARLEIMGKVHALLETLSESADTDPRPAAVNALTDVERAQVLGVLTGDRFVDKSVAQTWATLLDEGTYLCSPSSMHRVLRANNAAGERRSQAKHPPRVVPELLAVRPGQIWSWDITKLKGPERDVYYDLYVILDIFSRYVVGWTVAAREDSIIAKELMEAAMRVHGQPEVHADRGTSMTSKPVAQLLID